MGHKLSPVKFEKHSIHDVNLESLVALTHFLPEPLTREILLIIF